MVDTKLDGPNPQWMQRARLANAVTWLYLGLSEEFQPILTGGDFWTAKWQQLFQFGPYGTLPELVARMIIPGVLWLACDCAISAVTKRSDRAS